MKRSLLPVGRGRAPVPQQCDQDYDGTRNHESTRTDYDVRPQTHGRVLNHLPLLDVKFGRGGEGVSRRGILDSTTTQPRPCSDPIGVRLFLKVERRAHPPNTGS